MIHARLSFVLAISCAALLRLEAAEAQQTGRLPRIGILATTPSAYSQVLRQALGERGWVENRTVEFDFRYTEGKPELRVSVHRDHADRSIVITRIGRS